MLPELNRTSNCATEGQTQAKKQKQTPLQLKRRALPTLSFSGHPHQHPTGGGAAGDPGRAHGEVYSYDASGGKPKRTEKGFTATMETTRKTNVRGVDGGSAR